MLKKQFKKLRKKHNKYNKKIKIYKRNELFYENIKKYLHELKYIYKLLYISILIIALVLIYKRYKEKTAEIVKIPKKEDILKEYYFDSLQNSFSKAKYFLEQCLNGNLINNKTLFKYSDKPLISVVIPIYNCQNFITRAMRSVQNQNLLNIEIILVNDVSTDNTLSILEEFNKDDPRIKIINNKKNMGILYTRSIGVLSAKGKYIFPLDNDDMILDKDILSVIINIAKEGNFDIIEFKGIETNDGTNILNNGLRNTKYSNHKLNLVLFQPELSDFYMKGGSKINDEEILSLFIWCKIIKRSAYTKALNLLGEEKYSRFMISHEDNIAMIILFSTANSYKFVGKYGLLHIKRKNSSFFLADEIQMSVRNLYIADVAIDFLKKTNEHRKVIPHLIYKFLTAKNLEAVLNANEYYKNLLFSCLDRAINSDFYYKEYINEIINKVRKLTFINYPNIKRKVFLC